MIKLMKEISEENKELEFIKERLSYIVKNFNELIRILMDLNFQIRSLIEMLDLRGVNI